MGIKFVLSCDGETEDEEACTETLGPATSKQALRQLAQRRDWDLRATRCFCSECDERRASGMAQTFKGAMARDSDGDPVSNEGDDTPH